MDHESAFMSALINYLFKKLGIKIEIIAPYNYHLCRQNMELSHKLSYSQNLTR